MTITAIYPGTFDPITNGHSDLIKRARKLFPRLIVAVAKNPHKQPSFTLAQRLSMIRHVVGEQADFEVIGFDTLLIEFAKRCNATVILRGLRAVSDFEFEFQLANMNRKMNGEIETVFLTPAEHCSYLSSSLIKEIAALHGDIDPFVDPYVAQCLRERFG